MDITTNCPGCSTKVRVPDTLLGKSVKCPKCQTVFKAQEPQDAGFEEVPDDEEDRPRRRPPAPVDDEDEGDYERRPRRRWKQPHRGTTILVLGILSLVLCAPLGIAAWVMGNNDLDAMRRGAMDRSGEGTTQAGRICGMIASILMIIGCVGYGLMFVLLIATGAHR
jgi:predicted Zn finger-like uncharacterized protein